MKARLFFILALSVLIGCTNSSTYQKKKGNKKSKKYIPQIVYKVVKIHPHDTISFTEGFVFRNGQLFESTGSPENIPFTKSVFGTVDLTTGKITELGKLERKKYFGEGITFLNDKLFQLTYRSQTCFIYDAETFANKGHFYYQSKEGWGLTTDGSYLIMSDGTNILTYIDANNYKSVKELNVSKNGYAVDYLNELEFIDGYIYANVWTKNYIIKIDTSNGKVVGILDLASIANEIRNLGLFVDVMNGIAYDTVSDNMFITGKLWPYIYELEFYH